MANFGSDLLQKYGWVEGKGLGKNEDGITKPLRPTLKFDTAGLGHIKFLDLWPQITDTASIVNMQAQLDYKKVNMTYNDCKSNEDKIATEKRKDSQPVYKNFLKTSTLYNGNLVPAVKSKETEAAKEVSLSVSDRDEAILKAYERNARRKTRYNPMSSAKLHRIAMQDKMLLNNNNNLTHLIINPIKEDTETKEDTTTKQDSVTKEDIKLSINEHKIHIDTNASQTLTDYSKKRKMKELVRKLNNCNLKEDSGVGPVRNRRFYYMENKGNSFFHNVMEEFRTFHSLTPLGRMILEDKCDKKHEACKTIGEKNTHNSDGAKYLDEIDLRLENMNTYESYSTLRHESKELYKKTKLICKMKRRRKNERLIYGTKNKETDDIYDDDTTYNFEPECPPHLIGALREALKDKYSKVSRNLNLNNLRSITMTRDGQIYKPSKQQRSIIIHELMELAHKMEKKGVNDLVNSLTACNLAKDASAEIKKKSTQTHRMPV